MGEARLNESIADYKSGKTFCPVIDAPKSSLHVVVRRKAIKYMVADICL